MAMKHLNKQQKQAVIKGLDNDQVKWLTEICQNLMQKTVELDDKELALLKPHRCKIRKIARRGPLREKKAILMRGGFVGVLLSTLISSVLPMLIEKIVEK